MSTRTRIAAAALALAALSAGSVATAGAAATPTKSARPVWMQTPCEYEDSVNCFWDAGQMGNGRGHSFVVRQVPGSARMVCVFYVQTGYARTHDYCVAGGR